MAILYRSPYHTIEAWRTNIDGMGSDGSTLYLSCKVMAVNGCIYGLLLAYLREDLGKIKRCMCLYSLPSKKKMWEEGYFINLLVYAGVQISSVSFCQPPLWLSFWLLQLATVASECCFCMAPIQEINQPKHSTGLSIHLLVRAIVPCGMYKSYRELGRRPNSSGRQW